MKISVVTISYNQAEYIEDCILSVLGQSYSNIEHIVIDGNSTDGTLEILNKYQRKDTRFKFISEKDNGPASALNKGFDLATGEIFFFINSDDFILDGCLKFIYNFFKKNLDHDLLFTCGIIVDYKKKFIRNIYNSNPNIFLYSACFAEFFQQGMFIKKSLFLKTNGFNENNKISWDGELYCELLKLKPKYKRYFIKTSVFRAQKKAITQGQDYIINWEKEQRKQFLLIYPKLNFLFKNRILHIYKIINDPVLLIYRIKDKILKFFN